MGALNQCVLSRKDSNLDKQNQNLLCYHYTTRQNREQLLSNCERKGSNKFSIVQMFKEKNHKLLITSPLKDELINRSLGYMMHFIPGSIVANIPFRSGEVLYNNLLNRLAQCHYRNRSITICIQG